MRIAHFGTFDVENYGDLLFPLLIERRLAALKVEIVHVSPVGGAGVYADARPTISLAAADRMRFDAVVVGGGHIVHADRAPIARYAGDERIQRLAYAGLWLGASALAVDQGIPLVWNAPGVPGPFGRATAPLAAWAAGACDYIAVRDRRSAAHLRSAGFAGPLSIVPDTAIELPSMFERDALRSAYRDAFVSRGFEVVPERAVFIHLNRRYAIESDQVVAGRVSRIARRLEAVPILGALGPCQGDDEVARRVAAAIDSPVLVVDRPRGIRELVACLSESVAYVGSSLHGLITANAFGRPAIVVAKESRTRAAKFTGFLAQREDAEGSVSLAPVVLVPSWIEAEDHVDGLGAAGSRSEADTPPRRKLDWRVGGAPLDRIDQHWRRVEQALLRPTADGARRRLGSRRALSFLVGSGGGIDAWASPVVREQR